MLLTPYVFRQDPKKREHRCAYFESKRAQSLVFPVQPVMEQVVRKPHKPPPPESRSYGQAKILSHEPKGIGLVMGAQNAIRLEIAYEQAPPDTDVYVLISAVKGQKVVTPRMTYSLSGLKFSACEVPKLEGARFEIAEENHPLFVDAPIVGEIALAYVGTVTHEATGKVVGTVRFVPPPFQTYYNGVSLSPVVIGWNQKGERCFLYDGDRAGALVLPVLGRH